MQSPQERQHDERDGNRRSEARTVHGSVRGRPRSGDDGAAGADRRQARPVQGDGRRRAGHARGARRAHRTAASATSASGSASRPPAATSSTTPPTARSGCRPSRRWRWPTKTARPSSPAPSSCVAAVVKDEPQIAERFRSGEGFGWHEHHHDLFAGTERFFRPGYLANLVDVVAAGARRRRREALGGRPRRRHRLRPRRLDDPDGQGLPGVAVRRIGLPRGLDRSRPSRGRARAGSPIA